MTYKLHPCVGKIKSPVVLVLPTGEEKRFADGMDAAKADFDRHYAIAEMAAKGDVVLLTLEEVRMPQMNWAGEEATFF